MEGFLVTHMPRFLENPFTMQEKFPSNTCHVSKGYTQRRTRSTSVHIMHYTMTEGVLIVHNVSLEVYIRHVKKNTMMEGLLIVHMPCFLENCCTTPAASRREIGLVTRHTHYVRYTQDLSAHHRRCRCYRFGRRSCWHLC